MAEKVKSCDWCVCGSTCRHNNNIIANVWDVPYQRPTDGRPPIVAAVQKAVAEHCRLYSKKGDSNG